MLKQSLAIQDAKENKKNKFVEYAGLFIIGVLSLAYSLFYNNIAKWHVNLPFIKVPFFIGEIVFVICFLLFFIKWLINPKKINIFTYLSLFYTGFVIVKTFLGYFYWGSLSLRHAALFYYPLFAVFSYYFYRSDFFKPSKSLFLIFLIILIFSFSLFHLYFTFTCFILTLILINAYPKKPTRYILCSLLLLAIPYKLIFLTSRTFITSNLFAGIYICLGFINILKIKNKFKFIIFLIFILIISYGITRISDQNEVRSLFGFKELIQRYNMEKGILRIKEPTFVEPELRVKLYNEENMWSQKFGENPIIEWIKSQYFNPKNKSNISDGTFVKNSDFKLKPSDQPSIDQKDENIPRKEVKKMDNIDWNNVLMKVGAIFSIKETQEVDYLNLRDRGVGSPYGNSLFRIFIWEDVFRQLIAKRPMFGFDFGYPFRSRSIEILNWGAREWSKDGWVCLHNSYIDLIFHAGIIGLLMVVFILFMLFLVAISSFQNRSLTGILLSGILINWFIAANFLEILEMPYTAIPLWSLFGLTFAYLSKRKTL